MERNERAGGVDGTGENTSGGDEGTPIKRIKLLALLSSFSPASPATFTALTITYLP